MWSLTPADSVVPAASSADGLTIRLRDEGRRDARAAADSAERQVSELYRDSAAGLFSYAMARTRNEELSRDALQEAFMRYFVALCNGEVVSAPRAWIYRVLHNYLIDRQKECRWSREQSLETMPPCQDARQDIERSYLRNEVLAMVRQTLTGRELECFQLRSQGLRYEEIARALKLRSGTVGALISRAVRKLRSALGEPEGGRL